MSTTRLPGRPTKLTPELAATVVAYVRAGSFANVAARASGISESTYYRWLDRAATCATDHVTLIDAPLADVRARGKDRGLKCSRWGRERVIEALLVDEYPFWEFREAIKEAEAEAEISRLVKIESAADEHWQAAAWWLERRYPDRYGRKLLRLEDDAATAPEEASLENARAILAGRLDDLAARRRARPPAGHAQPG